MSAYFHPSERTALFIDGSNLYATSRALQFDIDYKSLLKYFKECSNLLRACYYTALIEESDYSPIKPLVDWLDYNGYTIMTKAAKEFTDNHGRRKTKGSMDVEMAIDMLELADKVQHMVLFTGDSDFRALVAALQRKGVRVSVVSTIKSDTPMIADELRRQADHFIELTDLRNRISRPKTDAADRD